jgi:CBS domain-containing protein
MYRVSDAMTADPLTVSPDDELAHAVALMKNARIRHLPVVRDGRLVGLVTQSDIRAVQHPAPARVRDVMVTDPQTATAGLPLRKAARTLWQKKFGCLPVIDEKRAVVGILTETDFIRFAADIATDFDRIEAIAVAGAHARG